MLQGHCIQSRNISCAREVDDKFGDEQLNSNQYTDLHRNVGYSCRRKMATDGRSTETAEQENDGHNGRDGNFRLIHHFPLGQF